MKGSYDNNTMDVSLKLTLINIRADENVLAHQEKEVEEFYDCDSITSNEDVTTDHLDDSVSGENAGMSDNHCSFDNISYPVIQSQGSSSTNIDISGSLCRVRSRESFNNVSSLKKSNTCKHFSSNNSTNTLSTASLSASSLSSTDNHNKYNNHHNNHNSYVEFSSQQTHPHNHPLRKRVTNNESQPLYTAPVLTRNNINKHVFSNNSNPSMSTFSSINDSLSSLSSLSLWSDTRYNLNYNMNSSNEVFSASEFQHQCFDNNISTNRQEPQPLRSPPMLTKSSVGKRDSFNNMRKSNHLQRKTPTKPSTPSTPRNSTTRTPRSNLEPPISNPNSGSNRRKSNRPFSPSITSPTASSVSRRHSHPYSKINWNDESEILEKFQLIQGRGVLPVPTELLQSRYSFMNKSKVVREWRALYPDEQVDISHQWSLQKKKLIADAAASSDIISPRKLDFESSSAADIKMHNKTDTTTDITTHTIIDDDEDQALDADEKDIQQNSVTLDTNKQKIGGADDNLLEIKNEGITGNTMESFINCFANLFP